MIELAYSRDLSDRPLARSMNARAHSQTLVPTASGILPAVGPTLDSRERVSSVGETPRYRVSARFTLVTHARGSQCMSAQRQALAHRVLKARRVCLGAPIWFPHLLAEEP